MYKTLLLLSVSILLAMQSLAVSDSIANSPSEINSKLHVNVNNGMVFISVDSLDFKHIKILDENGHLIVSQASSTVSNPLVFSAYSHLYYYTLHTSKGILSGIIKCPNQNSPPMASQ